MLLKLSTAAILLMSIFVAVAPQDFRKVLRHEDFLENFTQGFGKARASWWECTAIFGIFAF